MDEHKQHLLEHLRKITGGKSLMTTDQLEAETGFLTHQQAKWRMEKEFPIPHKKIGKRVYYSIYDVADFIAGGQKVEGAWYVDVKPSPKSKR